MIFSTWSVQRSSAEPFTLEKPGGERGSEPQKERKRKRERRQQLLEPFWWCSHRVDLLGWCWSPGIRGSGLCAAAGTVTLTECSCHLGLWLMAWALLSLCSPQLSFPCWGSTVSACSSSQQDISPKVLKQRAGTATQESPSLREYIS